jgi:putative N-acetyltransferase (TIGR04045 family)
MEKILCQIATSKEEILECYKIRHEVFVCEQKLFSGSDRDRNDKDSIHILAKRNGEAVGTVRIFKKKDIWFGGRLAVFKKSRRGDASKLLVKKAVEIAKIKKAKKFLAWVQAPNVNFFLRLGWKKVGNKKDYLGKPHQLMEADLSLET